MEDTSSLSGSVALAQGDRVLDRYRIDERVAIGGHSVVYRGEDERLARPVCIKVFDKLAADERVWRTAYEHFVQEAFALSRLTHPNTLRIYDFGHVSGTDNELSVPVQVSEYMNGGNLAQLVRRAGPLPLDEAVRVSSTMCDALAEAHACGIVHRDIKPPNILFGTVGSSRQPKLADFGIAKSFVQDGAALANRAGDTAVVAGFPMVMYSPSWAAPEQLAGDEASALADIYSLAAVTVYSMTGRVVFRAEDVSEGYDRRRGSDDLIESAFESIEVSVEALAVLKRACSFDRGDRPQDVSTFARELRAAFDHDVGGDTPLPLPPAPRSRPPLSLEVGRSEDPTASVERARPSSAPPPPPPSTQRPPPLAPVAHGGVPHGPRPQRLSPLAPARIAGRHCEFIVTADRSAVVSIGGVRVRVTLTPTSGDEVSLHMRGLSCFVARAGGRPSSAATIASDGELLLVSPRNDFISRVLVRFGRPAAGHTVFRIDDIDVAVGLNECPGAVLLDCGPEGGCHVIHHPPAETPGATRRRRSNVP